MTRRGWAALALGAALYVAAWAFGSRPLYPVAVGLLLLNPVAWACLRLSDRPLRLHRRSRKQEHIEGEDVDVEVELETEPRLPTVSVTLVETIDRIGERTSQLERRGRGRRGARYLLRGVPRGRYGFPDARVVLEDPFGLQRREIPLPGTTALLVFPRLVELERLFSEGGAGAHQGRRILLRRPVGYDVHGVREYEHGESLRRVHWPTTARRAQLMVKELEDSPRDEVAVVLDGSCPSVGEPPDSSFDVQVRAAGSILQAHVRRGRRAVLVVNGRVVESQRVHSLDGDWRRALELLAAAEAGAARSPASLLIDDAGPAARARDLTVVTGSLAGPVVERLVQRALGHVGVSVVFVDAASFVERGNGRADTAAVLRLQAAGIPVAVVRRGDRLAPALCGGIADPVWAAHG